MKQPPHPTPEELEKIREPIPRLYDVDPILEHVLKAAGIGYARHGRSEGDPYPFHKKSYLQIRTDAYVALDAACIWIYENVLFELEQPHDVRASHLSHTRLLRRAARSQAYAELILRILGVEPWDEGRFLTLKAEMILICQQEPGLGETE